MATQYYRKENIDKILTYIESNPDIVYSASDIVKAVDLNIHVVRPILNKLVKEEVLVTRYSLINPSVKKFYGKKRK